MDENLEEKNWDATVTVYIIIIQMKKHLLLKERKKGWTLNSLLNWNEKHWISTVRCSNETKQQQQQNQVQSKRKSTLLDYYYQKRRKILCLCVLIFKCWSNVESNMSATVLYLSPESPKPWKWINNNFSTKGIELTEIAYQIIFFFRSIVDIGLCLAHLLWISTDSASLHSVLNVK